MTTTAAGTNRAPSECHGQQVTPTSIVADWKDASAALSGADAIAAGGTPNNDYSNYYGVLYFMRERGQGTNIRVRMRYDPLTTVVTTQQTYVLFGRKSGTTGYGWQALPNRNGDIICTATADPTNDFVATNAAGTTARCTTPSWTLNTHDCDGCDEFMVLPVSTLGITGGVLTKAFLQAKII